MTSPPFPSLFTTRLILYLVSIFFCMYNPLTLLNLDLLYCLLVQTFVTLLLASIFLMIFYSYSHYKSSCKSKTEKYSFNIPHGSSQQMPPYGKSTPRSCDQEYEPMGGRTNTHLLQSSMQHKIQCQNGC